MARTLPTISETFLGQMKTMKLKINPYISPCMSQMGKYFRSIFMNMCRTSSSQTKRTGKNRSGAKPPFFLLRAVFTAVPLFD